MIEHFKEAVWHNINYVVESSVAWCLVGFGHVIGLRIQHPVIVDVLPYVQLISLLLACCASAYTIYKIRKDLKK